MKMLIISFNLLAICCLGQNPLPVYKLDKKIVLDTIKVIEAIDIGEDDSLRFSEYEILSNKIDIFCSRHPNYIPAHFTNVQSPYFGNIDSIIMRSPVSIKYHDYGRNYYTGKWFSFNQGIDTLLIGGELYIEINPFKNIFAYQHDTIIGIDTFKIQKGQPHYTFHSNKKLESAPIYNNEFGSVKYYWDDRGRIKKRGAFWLNEKNGPWIYYNKRGKVIKKETFDKGILISSD